MKYKWDNGMQLEKNGHRIFREDRGGFAAPETLRWAIADNSGQRPDTTDDGVLWLDFSRPLIIGEDGCGIPVVVERENGRESRCPCGIDAILTLKREFPEWRMEPDAHVLKILKLYPIATAARARSIDAGIALVIKEYGQGGMAAALLSFIEDHVAYRSDGDLTDQANYKLVSELRAIDEENICNTPRDNLRPMKVYVFSARCTGASGPCVFMGFDEDPNEAFNAMWTALNDTGSVESLRTRITPVEIPARTADIKEWLLQNSALWAVEE